MKNKIITIFMSAILLLGATGCGKAVDKKSDLLNNPKDTDVKNAIKNIEGIQDICLVTEDNDPNKQLNKKGGYTGTVFFRLSQVDEKIKDDEFATPYDKNACTAGTDGGGSIEIYPNKEDAKKRDDYLAGFDGSILASHHSLKGTVVVRISNDLTASEQKDLETKIIEILSEKK